MKSYLWLLAVCLAAALIFSGLRRGEWLDVKEQANNLCTACIGLTSGSH